MLSRRHFIHAAGGLAGRRMALAVGGAVPLILRGPVAVASWESAGLRTADPDFIAAVAQLYAHDPLFGPALGAGLKAQNFSQEVLGGDLQRARGFGPRGFAPLAEAAGRMLAAEDGPRIAVLDMGGWDTHVNQGAETGRLAQNLKGLAAGLDAMAKALGPAWRETMVIAVTEFGRTVAVNGNNGTDHGTASVLIVMGGAVKGGRVAGDWPGLARLQDDRDLRVTTDGRAVVKGILRDHLGLDAAFLGRKVFPDTAGLRPVGGCLEDENVARRRPASGWIFCCPHWSAVPESSTSGVRSHDRIRSLDGWRSVGRHVTSH